MGGPNEKKRHSTGSVLFDKGRGTWRFLQWINGKRRSQTIGTKQEFPTKASAWREVERLELPPLEASSTRGYTMKALVARYEAERFPVRHDTAQMYRSWLKNHILPKWGDQPLSAIQPQPVELWLRGLALAPKSKTHVRSIMHSLFEFAMFAGVLELGRNPTGLDHESTSHVPSSDSMLMQLKLKAPRKRSASHANCWNVCVYGSSAHNFVLTLIGSLQVP
jgi:hypothetical protein